LDTAHFYSKTIKSIPSKPAKTILGCESRWKIVPLLSIPIAPAKPS